MTYCDAEKAIRDDSYKSLSGKVLQEMMLACYSVTGPNASAIKRIHKFGDLIKAELESREVLINKQEGATELSPIIGVPREAGSNGEANPPSSSWSEERLTNLIRNRIEESLTVEYKAAGAISRDEKKKVEFTKDVSAMANSAGGVIVYGIAEFRAKEKRHLPERLDPVNRLEFTKEWIEHIVSQIRPRIFGLKIYPVQLSSGANDCAYVIEIPESTTAHQATDCRYYRRYNFESVPMADHEVRDVMNRKAHPTVNVSAEFFLYPQATRDGHAGALRVNIINASDVLARHVGLILNVPTRVRGKLIIYEAAVLDNIRGESSYLLKFSNSNGAPLFPRATLSPMFKFRVISNMVPEPEKEISDFRFIVFADSMAKQMGTFTLEEIIRTSPERHKLTP